MLNSCACHNWDPYVGGVNTPLRHVGNGHYHHVLCDKCTKPKLSNQTINDLSLNTWCLENTAIATSQELVIALNSQRILDKVSPELVLLDWLSRVPVPYDRESVWDFIHQVTPWHLSGNMTEHERALVDKSLGICKSIVGDEELFTTKILSMVDYAHWIVFNEHPDFYKLYFWEGKSCT